METRLAMDSKTKHLQMHFKKRFEHDSDVQLKVRGVLDTQTAQGQFWAGLHKFFRLGKLPAREPGDVFRPDNRVRLGIGAKGSSESEDVLFSVSAKKGATLHKRTEVVRNRVNLLSYTQLVAAANYDYNIRTEKWAGEASAVARHAMFGFSDGQDLRISAGYRVRFDARAGVTSQEPFLKLQENNWAIETTFKRDWLITYDL